MPQSVYNRPGKIKQFPRTVRLPFIYVKINHPNNLTICVYFAMLGIGDKY